MFPLLTLRPETTLAQVFSYEFCKNFKNTFFYRTPPVAASVFVKETKKTLSAQDSSNVTMTSQYQIGVRILHTYPRKPQENAITKLDKS